MSWIMGKQWVTSTVECFIDLGMALNMKSMKLILLPFYCTTHDLENAKQTFHYKKNI